MWFPKHNTFDMNIKHYSPLLEHGAVVKVHAKYLAAAAWSARIRQMSADSTHRQQIADERARASLATIKVDIHKVGSDKAHIILKAMVAACQAKHSTQ